MSKPKPLGYRPPVVLREDEWRVLIYRNDRAPPHVHVLKAGGIRVRLLLPAHGVPVCITDFRGGPDIQAARAAMLVQKHADELLSAWKRIDGLPGTD